MKVSARGVSRLKAGHVWVYRSDVISADGVEPGSLVQVADERGKLYGSALYSSTSQIAIRMLSSGPVKDVLALLDHREGPLLVGRAEGCQLGGELALSDF